MAPREILKVTTLKKAFGTLEVLRGVSFHLHEGECLGILGGSGSGKSVLLRSLSGLESLDEGQIEYRGQRLNQLREREWYPVRQKLAYIFQSGALFDSETLFENVAFPLWEHSRMKEEQIREKVESLLDWVGLKGKEHLMPEEISGGMRKRVSLARALAMDPDLILFDEPTAGLDPKNTTKIMKIMRELKERGMSSILVTHDLPLARDICDSLIVLDHGKVGYWGSPDISLHTKDEVVQKFLGEMNG